MHHQSHLDRSSLQRLWRLTGRQASGTQEAILSLEVKASWGLLGPPQTTSGRSCKHQSLDGPFGGGGAHF